MLKAPLTGSSMNGVPGTRVPFGITVPSTIGPRSFVHSLNRSASRPQPMVSKKTYRAVSSYGREDCQHSPPDNLIEQSVQQGPIEFYNCECSLPYP